MHGGYDVLACNSDSGTNIGYSSLRVLRCAGVMGA